MKINILTVGSRGDIQPYVALGVGLKAAGYDVRLTTHELFQPLITRYGLNFFPIGGNVQAILQGDVGQSTIEAGRNPIKVLQGLTKAFEPLMAELLEQSWQSCQDVDAIVSSGTAFWGNDIAERLGLPFFFGLLQPVNITGQFPHPLAPRINLGGLFNQFTYQCLNRFYWQLFKPSVAPWRQTRLQLPDHNGCPFFGDRWRQLTKLYGFSPTIVPRPVDWDDSCHVTGYWFLDAPNEFTPPAELLDFLADGEPPVSIGFGSMSSRDSESMTETALTALRQTGQRGLLLTGWGGIIQADLPDSVFKLEGIPHAWLFPKMKAIVHHGGAGTTAAALRSGVPSVVVPFFSDQPFWGDRTVRLGTSAASMQKRSLSVARLTEAIRTAVESESLRVKAQQVGHTLQSEDGVAAAVNVIKQRIGDCNGAID